MTQTFGIIGAGIAGLTVGRQLQSQGLAVELFDKGRAVGGRTSSRRTEWGYLDHGAQFFTIRDRAFQTFLQTHISPDGIQPWAVAFGQYKADRFHPDPREETRYIPPQAMSALCKQLAASLSVRTGVRICQLHRTQQWQVVAETGETYGPFDWLVVTAPPVQTAQIIAPHSAIAQEIGQLQMWPCWTLMLVPADGDGLSAGAIPFGGIQCEHPVLGWIGLNHTKPGRNATPSLTIQANWEWSAAHLEDDRGAVGIVLRQAAETILGVNLGTCRYEAVHLWRYAAPVKVAAQPYFLDAAQQLAACGDWCVAGRVEGAFLSAHALAQRIQSPNGMAMPG